KFSTAAIGSGVISAVIGTWRRSGSMSCDGLPRAPTSGAGATTWGRGPRSPQPARTAARTRNDGARMFARMSGPSRRGHPDRALLEVGLLGDRVGRVQGDLVDQLRGVEPGHEHHAARHPVAAPGLDPGPHRAAPRRHGDLVATLEAA